MWDFSAPTIRSTSSCFLSSHQEVRARDEERKHELVGRMVGAEKSQHSGDTAEFHGIRGSVLSSVVDLKSKEPRKTRRQQQADKRAVAKKLMDKANSIQHPLPLGFQKFVSKDGTNYDISCSRAKELSPDTLSWIFSLMEKNMKKAYQESPWGWNQEEKQAELSNSAAWHLVANSEGKNVGFSHFRFDLDDDKQVLYCYELQLESVARRKGLGRCMMHALESMALQNQMQKVVLTVFKNNAIAVPFFHALGYKLDSTSPQGSDAQHYVILSKQNLSRSDSNCCC